MGTVATVYYLNYLPIVVLLCDVRVVSQRHHSCYNTVNSNKSHNRQKFQFSVDII